MQFCDRKRHRHFRLSEVFGNARFICFLTLALSQSASTHAPSRNSPYPSSATQVVVSARPKTKVPIAETPRNADNVASLMTLSDGSPQGIRRAISCPEMGRPSLGVRLFHLALRGYVK